MCGILGIVKSREERVDAGLLARLLLLLSHRGPDSTGIHAQGPVGLAHSRLSIIDLEGGRQPMSNEDGSVWIVFNGEIFNYIELREELQRKGHRFATRSDTEVILHSYEEDGDECVHRLNGQWAFAIWDGRRRRLLLSRDRMGIRPLFYTRAGGQFLFASEVKVLLAHPDVPRRLDFRALQQIFTFWHAVPPRTIFDSILELPPGHSLVLERGEASVRPYWRLDFSQDEKAPTEDDAAERVRHLLIDAARLRLRSDVPVGTYLSGGLDSTITTALVRHFTDNPLKTFSVRFEDREFDESDYQREAVARLRTDHHEVRCTYDAIAGVFPTVVWHAETPILRTAPAPLYLLSALVRSQGYKVVLTGEGADELLGGYDIFKEAKIRRFWGARPDSTWRPLLLKRLYPYLRDIQSQSPAYLAAFFRVRSSELDDWSFSHLPRWDLTSKLKLLYSKETRRALSGQDPLEELRGELPEAYGAWDGFSRSQYLEARYLMPGYILSSQGDRMAMGNSVEGRFPFLDHRVAELAGRLPPRLKMRGLEEKHILKKAFRDLVPEAILKRPKQPYRAPEARSFFDGTRPRREYVRELLSAEALRRTGVFEPLAVARLLQKLERGGMLGVKDNMAIVGVLSTQLVIKQFIEHFGIVATDGRDAGTKSSRRRGACLHSG